MHCCTLSFKPHVTSYYCVLGLTIRENQNAVLAPTFLPNALNPRSQAEITAAALPFTGYHKSLALREQVRQAMISSTDTVSSNPGLTMANPQPNPLAYQMLGPTGLSMDQLVAGQNGRWPRAQVQLSERKNEATSRGKSRVRGGVRNDTCQYCGKVSNY